MKITRGQVEVELIMLSPLISERRHSERREESRSEGKTADPRGADLRLLLTYVHQDAFNLSPR